jgi:hypothetical protein
MPQSTKISFVVFADGKVDEGSLTVGGEEIARHRFIAGWLPSHIFGSLPNAGYSMDRIWQGAHEKGARSYTIEIGVDGEPKLTKR